MRQNNRHTSGPRKVTYCDPKRDNQFAGTFSRFADAPSSRLHPLRRGTGHELLFLPENSLTVSYSKTDAAASPNGPRKVTDYGPERMRGQT
jgi:hypothetical protein